MGAAASVVSPTQVDDVPEDILTINLKKLPEAIEESLFVQEKFVLIIDETEQASRFLKYQMGAFINFDDPTKFNPLSLNRSLVGAFQHGRTLTIKFKTLEGLDDSMFQEGMFPKEILNRQKFFVDDVWKSVVKPSLGDPDPAEIMIAQEFAFIICTATDFIPPQLRDVMRVIKVIDKQTTTGGGGGGGGGGNEGADTVMDQVASLYGASEVVRNSLHLVEAAFDGDLEELIGWIDKGYHLESCDGRKHTALSEASCQGHLAVMRYLMESGADPNALSDTGRSPLWRAAFNNHLEAVQMLLKGGADPEHRDRVSMENAYDIAQTDELRALLGGWDKDLTVALMETSRRSILMKIEERIKTGAERDQFAREKIRQELVLKAESGDMDGIREMLLMIADEAVKSNSRPRATAEVRNQGGQSLLSIAAQHDFEELARFLLTYWKECDKDRWELGVGEISVEAKCFKTNPNTRDLKGWSCVCIAVFHDSRKVLKLLLEHGGDPGVRSTYNKNAWDIAKDELDAANHVIKSKSEIRQVLMDYDTTGTQDRGKGIFGVSHRGANVRGGTGDIYEGLGSEGGPVVMNLEMNQIIAETPEKKKKKSSNTGKKGKISK